MSPSCPLSRRDFFSGTEEALLRAQAHSDIVRTLLDEAVKAVSRELGAVRTEGRRRDVALEELLDERMSGLEAKVVEVDNRAAKKRRRSDIGEETGLRIGGLERRLRQVFQHGCICGETGDGERYG